MKYRQFSLTSLISLTLIVCILAAWLYDRNRLENQISDLETRYSKRFFSHWESIQMLERRGAEVYFSADHVILRVGNDDRDLRRLSGWTNLRGLWVFGSDISEKGLRVVETLSNLRFLWIDDLAISDDALLPIQKLPRLESLRIEGIQLRNGLRVLEKARNLQILKLYELDGPLDLSFLRTLQDLKSLVIEDCQIEPDSIKFLGILPLLDGLSLSRTEITESELLLVLQNPSLETVFLDDKLVLDRRAPVKNPAAPPPPFVIPGEVVPGVQDSFRLDHEAQPK